MSGPLAGKTILITGAARRIGRGIALRLHSEGARVLIHYSRSEEEARQTAQECGNAPVFRADLAKVEEIAQLFEAVQSNGEKLWGLVNNAARFTRIHPLNVTEEDWDFIHNVNLKGMFFCCQGAARLMMRNGGGAIVNMSSLGGIRPWALHAHYCASKAGVIHMTRALAKAFAPTVRVNSVAPGVIPFDEAGEDHIRELVSKTPLGRAGTADDIADAVVYFLTSAFITGQLIAVDGGLSQD